MLKSKKGQKITLAAKEVFHMYIKDIIGQSFPISQADMASAISI